MKKFFLITFFFAFLGGVLFVFQKNPFLSQKHISKISQQSLQKEALSSFYLCQLLDLSHDKKIYKDDFDIEEGEKKLCASSLIEEASISFIDSSHLKVTYKHFTPFAVLSDFENIAIDVKGRLFPVKPFLSPTSIVKIFLGVKEICSDKSIDAYKEKERWLFARRCIEELRDSQISGKLSLVDVSRIEEESLGKNELIIEIDYPKRKDILRLTKRNYLNEVSNYIILCEKLENETQTLMIDFRFDSCAFIERF